MRQSRLRRSAGALVLVLAATLLLPVLALARVTAPPAPAHGCHCPVKMACCEAGLCHGDMEPERSAAPSWSGCRDEAPHRAVVPPPSAAFDGALPVEETPAASEAGAPIALTTPEGGNAPRPDPATPPPRASIASR
ncbi:MAG TPA: hypothetical protein P5164_09155 [Thermoanaerobaculia bacterium]|nr:hypothetical protein [Thermoanaerobaculia bacterium]